MIFMPLETIIFLFIIKNNIHIMSKKVTGLLNFGLDDAQFWLSLKDH